MSNQVDSQGNRWSNDLRVISANIRGFHTNIGELTHQFVLKNEADIVLAGETFLDDKAAPNYAKIPGYSNWIRKDRNARGGGLALCYKIGIQLQVIDEPLPDNVEMIIFKILDHRNQGVLFCVCYRPPSQGTVLLDYLIDNIDRLMVTYNCQNIVVLGDLNPVLVQSTLNDLMALHDLHNFVRFPTHRSGSSLDPVITDLPPHRVRCQPLGYVGTSDHEAVLTTMNLKIPKEEINTIE